jgi:probable phosphoglycerate mutase
LTEWSRTGRHTGITDLPLTPEGEQSAAQLRARLGQIHFDAVYSSPLQRARRTADLAGFEHPEITPLLKEVDYGKYEGLTTPAIRQADPDWEIYRDGSPGGETPAQIYARAQEFIDLVTEQPDSRVLAFSHGHFLRAVAVAWIGADITLAARLQLDEATINKLRAGERGRVIALWNAG